MPPPFNLPPLKPIGQGEFRNVPRPTNNNDDDDYEEVWKINLKDLTPIYGNNYHPNPLGWANKRPSKYMTPVATATADVPPARPTRAPNPPSTPTRPTRVPTRTRELKHPSTPPTRKRIRGNNAPSAPKKKVKTFNERKSRKGRKTRKGRKNENRR